MQMFWVEGMAAGVLFLLAACRTDGKGVPACMLPRSPAPNSAPLPTRPCTTLSPQGSVSEFNKVDTVAGRPERAMFGNDGK